MARKPSDPSARTDDLPGVGLRGEDLKAFTASLLDDLRGDEYSRSQWLRRIEHYYNRRYCRVDRGTNIPWENAADIVIPVMDQYVSRIKALILRFLLQRPTAVFQPVRPNVPEDTETAIHYELFFDWLLHTGMPDFREQLHVTVDHLVQTGMAPMKTVWEYVEEKRTLIFRREDALVRYADVILRVTRERAFEEMISRPPHVIRQVIDEAARATQDAVWDELAPRVKEDYGIEDKATLDKIMRAMRSGAEEVPYESIFRRSLPRVYAIHPADLIVPSSTNWIQQARRIAHQIWLTEEGFLQRAETSGWRERAVNEVLDARNSETNYQQGFLGGMGTPNPASLLQLYQGTREGVSPLGTADRDLIRVWEVHFWYTPRGHQIPIPVWMVVQPDTEAILRYPVQEPYNHGGHPFDQLRTELTSHSYYSPRGIPEMIDDIDWTITENHRWKLNKARLLVPAFTRRRVSCFNPESMEFRPGEFLDVLNHDDIRPIPIPDYTLTNEREELNLLQLTERYLGGLDTLAQQGNIHEARTAREIEALTQGRNEMLAYRVGVVSTGFTSLLRKVWSLWNQWGDGTTFRRVTGVAFKRQSPIEGRYRFRLVPSAAIHSVDPAFESSRAFNRLQALLNVVQIVGGQILDDTYKIELGRAVELWLSRENSVDVGSILRRLTTEEREELAAQKSEMESRARRRDDLEADASVARSIRERARATADVARAVPTGVGG